MKESGVNNSVQYKIEIECGDNWFSVRGPQLSSTIQVTMICRYRNDGNPACFIYKNNKIEAVASNIVQDDGERGFTTLGNGKIIISQVEHILSALYAMNCFDTDINLSTDINSDNMISPPIMYLNSMEFTLAIQRSFYERKWKEPIHLEKTYFIKENGDNKDCSFAIFTPYNKLNIKAHISFPHWWGNQDISFDITPEKYEREICWARSFFSTAFPHKEELKKLRERYPVLIREYARHNRSIMIDYDKEKWLTRVVSDDEPVRHKLLDFIGDVSLIGQPLNASIYVYKPHHSFNRYCVKKIFNELFVN